MSKLSMVESTLLQVLSNDGSGASQMSEGVHEGVMAAVSAFGSQQALRCLALAYKNHSGNSTKVLITPPCRPLQKPLDLNHRLADVAA